MTLIEKGTFCALRCYGSCIESSFQAGCSRSRRSTMLNFTHNLQPQWHPLRLLGSHSCWAQRQKRNQVLLEPAKGANGKAIQERQRVEASRRSVCYGQTSARKPSSPARKQSSPQHPKFRLLVLLLRLSWLLLLLVVFQQLCSSLPASGSTSRRRGWRFVHVARGPEFSLSPSFCSFSSSCVATDGC